MILDRRGRKIVRHEENDSEGSGLDRLLSLGQFPGEEDLKEKLEEVSRQLSKLIFKW